MAATTAGVSVATNATEVGETTFVLPGATTDLAADIAVIEQRFGAVDVVAHQRIPVPGSVETVDLRAQDPGRFAGPPSLRLLDGRYPVGAAEVSVTRGVARLFDLHLGGTWNARTVVGVVENPLHLDEEFALVAPGQADPPASVSVHVPGEPEFESLRLPSGAPLAIEARSATAKRMAAAAVLGLASIGLLFVGLVAVAGFAVMAQRRLRALGMLASLGATDRHVRLALLANGAAVGTVAASAGTAAGLAGWLAFAPALEEVVAHRIDRFDIPWWAIGVGVALAVGAAWWPARAAARIPPVTALSGRPPRPRPAHRFAALGGLLLGAGLVLLALARRERALYVVAGTVATTLGVLLLAPLAIRALAAAGRWSPIAVRLAVRDLARYQSRSGAALGAIALTMGIAATITVSAAAQRSAEARTGGNLPPNQLVAHLSPGGGRLVAAEVTATQLEQLQASVDGLAATLGAGAVLALQVAVDPSGGQVPGLGNQPGGKGVVSLVKVVAQGDGTSIEYVATPYVATSELLAHHGIRPGAVDATADILTSRTDLAGLRLLSAPRRTSEPVIQTVALPTYTSAPNTLVTPKALRDLGLQARPAGWLIDADHPLTSAEIEAARKLAAGVGLSIETRDTRRSLDDLGRGATVAGIVLALGVLAMTSGLIRTEAAGDLRVLAAAGARAGTRRAVTGATAGALALLGALLGTAGAYLALVAWHRSDLDVLGHPPVAALLLIVAGLPAIAAVAGWSLAGQEPPAMARRPLE